MSGAIRYSPGRRRFVQLLGWAGVATMARGGPALAQAASKSRGAGGKPEATPAPPAATPPPTSTAPTESKGPSEEARSLADVLRRRYPDHLDAQDLERIAKDIDGDLQGMKRLRDVKLTNQDEPDATFHA